MPDVYRILKSTLDDIADAIRAKTGGTGSLTPAQMVTEIGSIQTGGSLPTSISKIDGGSFTPASNTISTYQISHNLGVSPKGFVIWTDEIDLSTAANSSVIRGVFIVDESATNITSYLYQMGVYNQNFNSYTRWTGSNYSGYANQSYISYNVGNAFYVSGLQYKWFAWA